ncbi:MAG: recombination protein RecR [Planctomycetales bacterium]|nr:recombination protein RecR [Planctomycetales bacterium]
MAHLTESVVRVIDEFAKLPGIGRKSAERLAYHVLRVSASEALALADAIRDVKQNVRYCKNCFHLAEQNECDICRDPRRNQSQICVVEQPRDVLQLETSGAYSGLYHVLLGRISPLDGIGPDQLTIDSLVDRVKHGTVREIILATNPTVEGDGTALHISNRLAEYPVEITQLARGITTGSVLEFANKEILADALSGRRKF